MPPPLMANAGVCDDRGGGADGSGSKTGIDGGGSGAFSGAAVRLVPR